MPQQIFRPGGGTAPVPKTPNQLVTVSGNQIVTQAGDLIQANK